MKLFKYYLLTFGLLTVTQIKAQIYLEKFIGKSFESKVTYAATEFKSNMESENLKIEFTRFLQIKETNEFSLKLNRIRQISKNSMVNMDIDTDQPFPNNDYDKSALENYLQYINKSVKVTVNQKEIKGNTHNLWLAKLPILNKQQQFSGIFIHKYSKQNWIDTLETNDVITINKYIIENDSTLFLEGTSGLKQLKIEQDSNDSNTSNPNQGETIVAKSEGKRLIYSAKIYFNKSNNFINRIIGTINTVETLNIMGQKHNKNSNEFFQVLNRELQK